MKRIHQWQPVLVEMTLPLLISAIGLPAKSPMPRLSMEEEPVQVSLFCQQVSIQAGGLYVRERPSIYSPVVGSVPQGQTVTVQGPATSDGWVTIVAPLEGYTPVQYLSPCEWSTPSLSPFSDPLSPTSR